MEEAALEMDLENWEKKRVASLLPKLMPEKGGYVLRLQNGEPGAETGVHERCLK